MPADERSQAALNALRSGEVEILGRLPWASNATLLARVRCGPEELMAVYKPGRGERRLWDFPPDIFKREVAAYALSEHLGWHFVPETVLRDGPLGPGSLQRFIDADHEQHYFTILENPVTHMELRRLAVFDLLTNQTDRKAGHVLLDRAGGIWAVDNGLAFHEEFKIRTVIWDFAGSPIDDEICTALQRVVDEDLPGDVTDILDEVELAALLERAEALLAERVLPQPPWGQHSYPWPLV